LYLSRPQIGLRKNHQYVYFIVESMDYASAMAQSLSHAEAAASDVLSANRRHYCGAGDIIFARRNAYASEQDGLENESWSWRKSYAVGTAERL